MTIEAMARELGISRRTIERWNRIEGFNSLTSAVAVLSAADPVRLFQRFATLDLLSEGRDERAVGRGSSIEAFRLFGYDLNDYDALLYVMARM